MSILLRDTSLYFDWQNANYQELKVIQKDESDKSIQPPSITFDREGI